MDLEKALAIIDSTFDQWIINENLDIFRRYKVIDALNVCLDNCIESGDNSPAFYDDITDEVGIRDQLHYISDRWFCSGRIRFILRIINDR